MIDLHLHTTASDGVLPPASLVTAAAAAGLTVLSVTDHDTLGGCAEALAAAASFGITALPGVEITAIEDGRDVHVLGYFFDPLSPVLASFLEEQRDQRAQRIEEIGRRLADVGAPVDISPLVARAREGVASIGRPHVARLLVDAGHAASIDDAFARFLGEGACAHVRRGGPTLAEVVEAIGRAGGLASLAHPGLLRRDDWIPRFASAGVAAIEAVHPEHDEAARRHYVGLAAQLGLAVTGGSDYHGDLPHRATGRDRSLGQVSLPAADFSRLVATAARRGCHVPIGLG